MTHVVRHTDPDRFLAAARPALAGNGASAAAFTAWARSIAASGDEAGTSYLATFAHAGRYGAALRRADGPLVFEVTEPEVAIAFARDLAPEAPRLQGVVGAEPACAAFARTWLQCTGRVAALRFRMRHHMLTAVASIPPASGGPRRAVAADGDWLVESQFAFVREAGVPDNPERMLAAIPRRVARGEFWIWEDGGPVSYAGWSEAGADAARIAPVYTLPAARRRGYATALVAALAQTILAAGRPRVFLMTDVLNPTSNAIYARIGFRPGAEVCHFDFVDGA